MKEGKYGIAYEGYPLLVFFGLCSIVFALFSWKIISILFLVLFFFTLHFFRDPCRVTPQDIAVAIAPADGKIIRIEKKFDPIDNQEKTCISIFMNVFSVHINRSPVSGTVKKILYFKGKYLNAAFDKASVENERCAYQVCDTDNHVWTFVQISGLIARRIVCRTSENTFLQRGERFGLIRFGSRVDVYIPSAYVPAVSLGDKVFAAETIIAKQI